MTVHVGWVLHRPTLPEVSLHSRSLSLAPPRSVRVFVFARVGPSSRRDTVQALSTNARARRSFPRKLRTVPVYRVSGTDQFTCHPFPSCNAARAISPACHPTRFATHYRAEQSRGNGRSIIVKADRQLVHYFFPPRATGMTSEGNNGRWPKSCRKHKENKN